MKQNETPISDVSDTATWVAYYRVLESERTDALFRDPLAKVLVGDKGKTITESMKKSLSKWTEWSVIIRTRIIDQYIQNLIPDGVDTVINLGAGLDTRPYRLNLPSTLRWIEVDYPHTMEHKEKVLANERPTCQLERVKMDLADRASRQAFLRDVSAQGKKVLVLTEGVIPYLTQDQVQSLGEDLFAQSNFTYWITEYFSPVAYRYLQSPKRMEQLKNAPFQFYPADWFGFFNKLGWKVKEIRYSWNESESWGRSVPLPAWVQMLRKLIPIKSPKARQMSGWVIWER